MQVPNNLVEGMLKNITDPKMREVYGQIINDQITHQIRCTSKSCQNRIIGYIYQNGSAGTIVRDNPLLDGKGVIVLNKKTGLQASGVYTSRERLDGKRGFRCWCGNNSILAKEEQGVIGTHMPTKQDIETVARRLMQNGSNASPSINGSMNVDGFIIEEVKA